MPVVPTVDASAAARRIERRRVGTGHLVLGLVLLALYALTMTVAVDHGGPAACDVTGGSCAEIREP